MKSFELRQPCQDVSVYKKMLSEISDINIRRSSKFNILAIYGALQCMKEVDFSENLGVYIVTQYASASSVMQALKKQELGRAITPFEFLNINSNTAAFYVSKILNSKGRNMVITSKNNTLEDGMALAKIDLQLGIINNALIGLVDESIDPISMNMPSTPDVSHWVYLPSLSDESSS